MTEQHLRELSKVKENTDKRNVNSLVSVEMLPPPSLQSDVKLLEHE